MKPKFSLLAKNLQQIKKDSLYRKLQTGVVLGPHITINGHKKLNLCSNDYLGMPKTTLKISQMQSSSRLVSGNDPKYEILEKKLSKHKQQKKTLLFPTGYMANLAISGIIQKGDLVLSDQLNHSSIIDAIKLSKGKLSIYKHNDIHDLESKLSQKNKTKFIITEGVFSMDGDYAKLDQITKLAAKYQAITILDDAHGDFTVGRDGKGTGNKFGVQKDIDIYTSSLSKGLGSFGGYISGNPLVMDIITNKSRSFIYTSALPAGIIQHAITRFDSNREKFRKKLQNNQRYITTHLEEIGYDITSKTHIIPIIIGDEKTAMQFGAFLLKNGIFAQPIRYPTVPKKTARLRLSITAWFTPKQLDYTISVLQQAGKKFGILAK